MYSKNRFNIALCLRGAISKNNNSSNYANTLYTNEKNYVNFKAVYNSIKKHILESNLDHNIDIFIHSWNFDLEDELKKLYTPVSFLFENNDIYTEEINKRIKHPRSFSQVSHALSIKKVLQLKDNYELDNNVKYDKVILYRPDSYLFKDMNLNDYLSDEVIYVNNHTYFGNECAGDFHYVFSNKFSKYFKLLYNSSLYGNQPFEHFYVRNFLINMSKLNMKMDNIEPGYHQDVARFDKINYGINELNLDPNIFYEYGFEFKDLYPQDQTKL